MINILLKKLDIDTRRTWAEREESTENNVSIETFLKFIFNRCDALESCHPVRHTSGKRKATVHLANEDQNTSEKLCVVCKQSHKISSCTQFKAMELLTRRSFIRDNKLCFNCLAQNHTAKQYTSKYRCRQCQGIHHTLVHYTPQVELDLRPTTTIPPTDTQQTTAGMSHFSAGTMLLQRAQTLMPTILAHVINKWGKLIICRLLLDSGSTIKLASEAFVRRSKSITCPNLGGWALSQSRRYHSRMHQVASTISYN